MEPDSLTTHKLKAVGWWGSPHPSLMRAWPPNIRTQIAESYRQEAAKLRAGVPTFPLPDLLLKTLGPRSYDARVIRHLRAGIHFNRQAGYAFCRCCGREDSEMGDGERTDGVWIWPDGLVHYVRVHGVPLPDAFLAAIASALDLPPPDLRPPIGVTWPDYDFTFWFEWAATVLKTPAP